MAFNAAARAARQVALDMLLLRLLPCVLVLLAGCASLPAHEPAPPQFAISEVSGTFLGRAANAALPAGDPQLSGYRLLADGPAAFDTRLPPWREK